ncbi:glycosyl transferase, partial [Lasius niger]
MKKQSIPRKLIQRRKKKNFTCRPWHRCYIETWTWHVRISGRCDRLPKYDCGGEVAVCRVDREYACTEYDDYFNDVCDERLESKIPCNVTLPLFSVNKAQKSRAITRVRFNSQPIRPNAKPDRPNTKPGRPHAKSDRPIAQPDRPIAQPDRPNT